MIFLSNFAQGQIFESKPKIIIVGSATAFPFIAEFSEDFAKFHQVPSPLIEANGTGSGVKTFCMNYKNPTNAPDLIFASRRMTLNEIADCKRNGINDLQEFELGLDGIVLATKGKLIKSLKSSELFQAISSSTLDLQQNELKYWSEINENFPRLRIEIYGPNDNSGTRDALNELLLEKMCKELKLNLGEKCNMIRNDGAFIIMGSNNLIIQKLKENHRALGIIGFNFFRQNQAWLNGIKIDNVPPTSENIASKKYAFSRKIYFYARKSNLEKQNLLRKFVTEIKGQHVIGKDGFLTKQGLVQSEKQ